MIAGDEICMSFNSIINMCHLICCTVGVNALAADHLMYQVQTGNHSHGCYNRPVFVLSPPIGLHVLTYLFGYFNFISLGKLFVKAVRFLFDSFD